MSDHDEAWMGWKHERVFPFDPRDKAIREGGLKKEDVMSDYDELLARLDQYGDTVWDSDMLEAAATIRRLIAERDKWQGESRFSFAAWKTADHQRTELTAALEERDRVIAEANNRFGPRPDDTPEDMLSDIAAILSQVPDNTNLDKIRANAWDEGAKWAAVETGAIRDERSQFLAPGDNPYRKDTE